MQLADDNTNTPHKQPNKTRQLVLALVAVAVVIAGGLILLDGNSNEGQDDSTRQEPSKDLLLIGEEGMLTNNDDLSDCTGQVLVAATQEDHDAITTAAAAQDKAGLDELLLQGRMFLANNCNKIKVIEDGGLLSGTAKVRFLDPEPSLPIETGWVSYNFAIKRQIQ